MLKDSVSYAHDDMLARKLREEQVEANRVIEALSAALAADGEQLLSAPERERIENSLQALIQVSQSDDASAIKQAVQALEQVCGFYVERRMNAGIQHAMAGHKVEEFE
jgi:molecular chaperone HscA